MQATEGVGPTPPSRSWSRWLLALLLVLGAVGFYALGLHHYLTWDYVRGHLDRLRAEVDQRPLVSVMAFALVYTTMTALSLPAAWVLSLTAGVLFGRWLGLGVALLSATAGATLAFLSSRYLLRDWVQRRFGARLEGVQRGVEKDGTYYLLTLRVVPVFPFFLINLAMGLTRMPVGTFAGVTFVGMAPGAFLYVNAGAELGALASPKDILSPTVLLSLALLGLLPLVLRLLLRPRRPR